MNERPEAPLPTAEQWRRVERLFHEASTLETTERQRYLASADPTVRAEVEALLDAAPRAAGRLEGVLSEALDAVDDSAAATPERIGPYRVLEPLGEGGLATVYLAERDDRQYRKRVAIKVVKRGMDTVEILRRLRLERQILAGLEHPNVARLLDGGSTEDGLPYVVMEAIDGVPVDTHCDERRLGLRARLEIFAKICSAVEAAHRSLVIHRDLKPSNILVTAEGEPKLLDFGIAKLLDPTAVDESVVVTRPGARWMTPAYASPEQQRGEPLTTAADVYALGVVLYELLAGRRPFADAALRRSVADDRQPPRPSARLAASAPGEPSVADIAAARSDTPERLRRRLRGDLDAIASVAIDPDPRRRYRSVAALRDDVERFLQSEPIAARPASAALRLQKFVRRHRTAVVAALLVALSVAVGFAATWRALEEARRERVRAERHLSELEEVVAFNVEMFEIADPGEARGDRITVREVLDRAGTRASVQLADRPAVAARLLSTLGRVHQALGLYERAGELLEQALDLRRRAFGERSEEAMEGLFELAAVRRDEGRFDESRTLYESARAGAVEDAPERPGDETRRSREARALHGLGTVELLAGDWEAAERLLRTALALETSDREERAEIANDLGEVLFQTGSMAEARDFFQRALVDRRAILGADHPASLETLYNLATVAAEEGRTDEAVERLEEVLHLRRRLYEGAHPSVARTLRSLANAYGDQGEVASAEAALKEAVEIAERGGFESEFVLSLRDLSRRYVVAERLSEAEPLLRQALALQRELTGDEHPETVQTLYSLGRVVALSGRPRLAVELLEEQIELQSSLEGMPEEFLAFPLALLAEQHAALGDCAAARAERARSAKAAAAASETSPSLAARFAAIDESCPP